MRNRALAAVLLAAIVASCGGGASSSVSEGCTSDPQCPDGHVCYREVCLDPLGDDDDDGLPNEVERLLSLDPFSADTDADGAPDALEVGDWAAPADTDADGRIDAIEHDLVDADRDCLPAPLDADEAVVEADPQVLVAFLCRHLGACAAATAAVAIHCVQGAHACDYDRVAGFEQVESLCDHVDNDCDGQTDEGATWRGLPPGDACRGEGACGWGTVECRADGRVACSSNPDGSAPGSTTELCNGQDDDCDGATDEEALYHGAALEQPCDGVGACGAGVVVCRADGTATCSSNPDGGAPQDQVEACNGQDDDCDGQTDEDLVGSVIDRCPLSGVCAAAFSSLDVACVDGHWACDLSAVDGYEPAPEASCDGQDNDCDGLTDEDLMPLRGVVECLGEGVCAATPPKASCVAGQWQCGYDGIPSFESTEITCDGQDNDCDGVADGGLPIVVASTWSLVPELPIDIDPAGPEEPGHPVYVDRDFVWVLLRGTLWTGMPELGQWIPALHVEALATDRPDWLGRGADGFYVGWPATGLDDPLRVARIDVDGTAATLADLAVCAPGTRVFTLAGVTGAWCVGATMAATTLAGARPEGDEAPVQTLDDPTRGPFARRPAPAGPGLVYLVGSSDALAWSPLAPLEATIVPFGGDAGEVTAAWVDPGGPRFFLKSTASPTGWFFAQAGALEVLEADAPFDVALVGATTAGFDEARRRLIHVGARDGQGAPLAGVFALSEACP